MSAMHAWHECVFHTHEDAFSLDLICTMTGPVGRATVRISRHTRLVEWPYAYRAYDRFEIVAKCAEPQIYTGCRTVYDQ